MLRCMDQDEKVRENKIRRMAERQGYRLVKSRRRDPRATDYGVCELVPGKGKPRAFKSIDDVEAFLTR